MYVIFIKDMLSESARRFGFGEQGLPAGLRDGEAAAQRPHHARYRLPAAPILLHLHTCRASQVPVYVVIYQCIIKGTVHEKNINYK